MNATKRVIAELVKSGSKCNIVNHTEAFNQAIDECGNSQIMIIPIIGQYQTGKSTFLSVLLGMDSIEIGDGVEDETLGIVFYGPVNYSDLLCRFELKSRIQKDIKLIFVDTQGYGGWKAGINDGNINITRLLSSVIPLSQIILLYTNSNDSIVNVQTLQDFLDLMKCCFKSFKEEDFQIINLIRMYGKIANIEYKNPTRDKYVQLSEQLKIIQTPKYKSIQISKFLPYPHYDNEVRYPRDNLLNESFKSGFIFIVTDLIQSIEQISVRLHLNAERMKAIYSLYSSSTGANYSLKLFADQSRKNVDMEILQKQINEKIYPVIQCHFNYLETEFEKCKKQSGYPYMINFIEITTCTNITMNDLKAEVKKVANDNLSYSSEIIELYKIRLRNDFRDVASSKLTNFIDKLRNDQVEYAVNDISKELRTVENEVSFDIYEFSKRNENKFSWDKYDKKTNEVIESAIKNISQFPIPKESINEIRNKVEKIQKDMKINLTVKLRNVVERNIEQHTQRMIEIGENLKSFGEGMLDVIYGLIQLGGVIAENLTEEDIEKIAKYRVSKK